MATLNILNLFSEIANWQAHTGEADLSWGELLALTVDGSYVVSFLCLHHNGSRQNNIKVWKKMEDERYQLHLREAPRNNFRFSIILPPG